MDIKVMTHVARNIIPSYDLHKRMQIPATNAIPNRDAARQIVKDMRDWDYFLPFICLLINISQRGYHGKSYSIPHITSILHQLEEEGLIYHIQDQHFRENPQIRRSHNWGILREGESYPFTLMKLDFVKNSSTVRKNPKDLVKKCYRVLRQEMVDILEFHQGRQWFWEGDGGVFAFHYSNRNRSAVVTALEIQHRMFLFNHFRNPLNNPVQLRIALLSRQSEYWSQKGAIRQSEVYLKIEKQESNCTEAGGITISNEVYSHLEKELARLFYPYEKEEGEKLYQYKLRWES
jgi:hypothetical protein